MIHNRNYLLPITYYPNYQIKKEIPRTVYKPGYPTEVNCLGNLIRKTRMDLGWEIKTLAKILKVEEDTIINWEYRRMQPRISLLKSVVEFLEPRINGSITKDKFWKICFQNDKFYPEQQNTFGEKLRATRMQRFLSIKQLARRLKVDVTTIANWELGKTDPSPERSERIQRWIREQNCKTFKS